MEQLTPDQIERLHQTVQEGAIIRDWCQHQGYKLFKLWIEGKIQDKKKEWLIADEKDAEKIRQQTSVWNQVLEELKKWMLKGDNASHLLQEHSKLVEDQKDFISPSA